MRALDPHWRRGFSIDRWFLEPCEEAGSLFGLEVVDALHEETSPYQRIQVMHTAHFGRILVLDGFLMLSQRDAFIYHEMLVHPALFTHPDPRKVLIIGGGDCGCLREVLRHSCVVRAEQVELDERVTRVAERYFPELCAANADARAHLRFDDGIRWVHDAADGAYDVVIVDSTDPIGQAARLFERAFYAECRRLLGPAGVLCVQSESPLIHPAELRSIRAGMQAAGFSGITTLQFPQCTYPSGWWSVTLAGGQHAEGDFRVQDAAQAGLSTRYYSADVHRAGMVLPPFLLEALRA